MHDSHGKLSIAMIGTRGVPARYGGFETAIEEIGVRLAADGHQVRVYCRGAGGDRPAFYRGMELVYLPSVRHRTMETMSHSVLSVLHLILKPTSVVLMFNAANAILLPLLKLRSLPVAVHVDGLEWLRSKWGRFGKKFYLVSEGLAAHWADELIADAEGIRDYYRSKYQVECELLTYGSPVSPANSEDRLAEVELEPNDYYLVVARMEPENHVDVIIQGFVRSSSRRRLVVVGSVPYASDFDRRVQDLARADSRIRMLGGVWDQVLLDTLYSNAFSYLHGHSVGGTNPSLLRAMGAGSATIAWDVSFNREVLGDLGLFFDSPGSVCEAIRCSEEDESATILRGVKSVASVQSRYNWDDVAAGYKNLCVKLCDVRTER